MQYVCCFHWAAAANVQEINSNENKNLIRLWLTTSNDYGSLSYLLQLIFIDFTSRELPPIMIMNSPDSQSYFRSEL